MSAAASARGKVTAPTDVDSIMPLLFATIGNPAISFKKMAAMDAEDRTESSLEHKFRKWRQMGREIAEKNPEHAGSFTAVTPKKPRAAPAKEGGIAKSKAKQPTVVDEEGAVDDEEEGGAAGSFTAVTPKKPRAAPAKNGGNAKSKGKQPDVVDEAGAVGDEEEGAAAGSFTAVTPKKPRAAPAKNRGNAQSKGKQPTVVDEEGAVDDDEEEDGAVVKQEVNDDTATNCNDKRSFSKIANEDGENPTKKTKVTKKGTAKVVKKPAAKVREVNEEVDGSAQEEEVEAAAPKANSRAKAAPKSKAAANKGKKPTTSKSKLVLAAEQGRKALNEADEAMDADIDAAEDDELHGMVPMRFEQEA